MKIKDIAGFRKWYKELIPTRRKHPEDWNENFMGVQHGDESGFLQMYHGGKDDIYGFLRKEVEMAEDGQAIYEFVQNAADCGSTHFYMLYDDQYLLAINNGESFSKEGIKSILDIGQSYGKTTPDKIGKYGIGFKLVHRLVGKSSGLDELLNDDGLGYRGPILFSWYSLDQFNSLIESNKIETGDFEDDEYSWLLKIIMTNFPSTPDEKVLDKEYRENIPFPKSEFDELKNFLSNKIEHLQKDVLKTGSLFFIKLGQNKYEYLEKQKFEYITGLETSMHFLNGLSSITINNSKSIKNDNITSFIKIKLEKGSEQFISVGLTELRDRESDIIFDIHFGESVSSAIAIKSQPNIYKYFPAVKEVNNLALIIHCNVFELSSNRQNLTNTPINRRLLSEISRSLTAKMESFKLTDTEKYINLYLSILISEGSSSISGNGWQNEFLYDVLVNFIKKNVPTYNGKYLENNLVLLKRTALEIDPGDFGISKEWFFWNSRDDKRLTEEATKSEKIGLKEWDLAELLNHADINKVNQWIRNTDESEILIFLDEINKEREIKNLSNIEFLKCSDGNFYSLDQIGKSTNIVVLFDKIEDLAAILNKLNLITTNIDISKYELIRQKASNSLAYLTVIQEKKLFDVFVKSSEGLSDLDSSEKKKLFLSMKALHNVGGETLKQWGIFKDQNGAIKPTGELISCTLHISDSWLSRYQIHTAEYFSELDEFLVKREDIYPSIIFPKWSEIISTNTFTEQSIEGFYNSIKQYYHPDKHKDKNLGTAKYIFSGSEFLENSRVFFHKEFKAFSNYPSLALAIKKVTEYETPSQKILRFLIAPPFETKDDVLLDHLQNASLEISEANELLRFCKKTEVKIFTKATFSEIENSIFFSVNSLKKQYYSSDKNLIEFINLHLFEDFELLPSNLSNFKYFDGLLRNQDLYTNINSLINNKPALGLDVFRLFNHQDLIVNYLRGLDKILLDAKAEIDHDSFEYLCISNIIRYFQESEYIHLKEKITIKSDDRIFKLNEVNASNNITFYLNDKKYPLKISDILPEADNYSKSAILDTLISKFYGIGLSVAKLFRIDTEEEILLDKIATDLLDAIENNLLTNSAQVAFALLYKTKHTDWVEFNQLKVYSLSDREYPLGDIWYLRLYSFLQENAIISKKYRGLAKMLNLNKREPFFQIGTDCHVVLKPAFDKEDNFFCRLIEENLNSEKSQSFFDFLFEEYSTGSTYRKSKFKSADWSKLGDTEIAKVIGFSPRVTILTKETEFAEFVLDSEKAPDWLFQWSSTAEKVVFVGILGIHTSTSDIIRLRKSFKNEPVITDEALVSSSSLNDTLLEQTLEWLGEKSIVVADDERLALFKAIISKLKWPQDEGWSIDQEALDVQSNEWDDADYKTWQAEPNSFEVRELLGSIPYKYEYSEGVKIAEERYGDYWFDKNTRIFYANKLMNTLLQLQLAAQNGILDTSLINNLMNRATIRIVRLEEEIKNLIQKNENNLPESPKVEVPVEDPARRRFLSEWPGESRQRFNFSWLIAALEWEYEQSKASLNQKTKLLFKFLHTPQGQQLSLNEVDTDEIPINLSYLKELSSNKMYIEILTPNRAKQRIENFVILESTDNSILIEVLDHTFPLIHALSSAALILPKDNLLLRGLLEFWKNTGFEDSVSLTLIEWLRKKFNPSDLEFIFGPPGTGKTTELAQTIISHLEYAKRIIVLTPTNRAADVLFLRIHEALGKSTDCSALVQRFDRDNKRNLLDGGDAVVVVSTIHRFVMNSFSDGTSLRGIHWDLCAIDEASMIALPYFFVPLVAASQAKFIVAGDPFQLLPIGETPSLRDQLEFDEKGISPLSGFATENIYTLLKIDRFEPGTTELDHSIRLLTHNYRSLPSIVHLFSRFQYRDSKDSEILTCESTSDTRQIRLKGNLLPIILQVDFPVQLPLSHYEPQLTDILLYGFGAYHIQSAILSISLAKQLLDENPGITISILSPYALQVKLCEALLKPDRKKYGNRLFVSSVHRSQGEETDVTIVLLNPASRKKTDDGRMIAGKISHFNNPNLLNVAISRPKCQLIILKPTDVFVRSKNAGYTLEDEVLSRATNLDMETWDANTLEEKLFGSTYSIKDSTYLQKIHSFDVFSMDQIESERFDRIFLIGKRNVQLILPRR